MTTQNANLKTALEIRSLIRDRRKALKDQLPDVMTRIIALKGKPHWGVMMRVVGGITHRVFNFEDPHYTYESLMIDEIAFEALVEDIEKAEQA